MDIKTYALSKKYTDETVVGGGAIKGKNATIDSITAITGGHRVTFKWTLDDGTVKTETMDVMDGEKGATGDTGAQGIQGIQGIKGDKGDDGYPFLIYKQYDTIEDYSASDFPEVGLMFMVMTADIDPETEQSIGYPVYRYTGDGYSLVVHLASEGIKGDKGDKGDTGAQGIQGEKGERGLQGESAYEVAVDEGFIGTEEEWLASLKGDKGDPGSWGGTADDVEYDNTTSGLTATDVQTALDEIASGGGSGIEGRLEACEQNVLALMVAMRIETDAEVNGTADNIVVEVFDDATGFTMVSGYYDGANHRLYA